MKRLEEEGKLYASMIERRKQELADKSKRRGTYTCSEFDQISHINL